MTWQSTRARSCAHIFRGWRGSTVERADGLVASWPNFIFLHGFNVRRSIVDRPFIIGRAVRPFVTLSLWLLISSCKRKRRVPSTEDRGVMFGAISYPYTKQRKYKPSLRYANICRNTCKISLEYFLSSLSLLFIFRSCSFSPSLLLLLVSFFRLCTFYTFAILSFSTIKTYPMLCCLMSKVNS